MLVPVDDDVGAAAPARHSDRHQLVGEPARLVRGHRPLM
jgi:hypothetical protein